MNVILVVNAGSSSLKFQLFHVDGSTDLRLVIQGQFEGVGTRPRLKAHDNAGATLIDETFSPEKAPDVAAATELTANWLRGLRGYTLVAAGHRVVHGGPEFDRPVHIDDGVIDQLQLFELLAPLHQPNNLAAIRTMRRNRPGLPQVACFDTAFHRGHSMLADRYAIPESLYNEGVRRYGFHGLSYEYISHRLPQVAPHIANGRVIVAHLGSGASMCALSNCRSVESTLGFTALDGLPMGTRPGQLDPGVVLYLFQVKQMSASDVQDLLYGSCGLKGLSGISNDLRVLEASADPRSAFALDYFAYRAGLNAAMLAGALGGMDAFVFTAGIGEKSASMRARIAERLAWLGIKLNPQANAASQELISETGSTPVYMIPTNEELMIARHTLTLLASSDSVF